MNTSPHDSVELTDAVGAALDKTQEATGCEVAGLYVLEGPPADGQLKLLAERGLTADERAEARELPATTGLCGHAVSVMSPVALARGSRLPAGVSPTALERAAAAFACVPFIFDGERRGAIFVMSRERRRDGKRLLSVVKLVAEAARAALDEKTEERRRYQQLAANVGDCFWTLYLDPQTRLTLMSEGVQELLGYGREELLARPELWLDVVHPDDRWARDRIFQRVRDGATTDVQYRVRMLRRDGDTRWTYTRGRAVRDGLGLRVDAITSDITDHVRLEEKVRRADRLSAVGMLAGGIAHEYNNLHFAILGTLDLLLMRDDLDAGIRQHVNRVRDAAQRASEITNNLVAFARGGTGVRAVINLSELVQSTLNVVRKEFTTSGVDIEFDLWPEPVPAVGNRAELGQVLINLVINSRQAMEDSPTRKLAIATGARDGQVYVRIADTGHGVSPENLPRLFDPFFTTKGAAGSWLEDRTESDAYMPGHGLGLSVAQTIVTEHGGEIEVESAPDEGATFTVYLPRYEPEGGVLTTDPMAAHVRKGRILVADDEPSVRAVCRELLQRLSYEVTEASGGEEALELLTRDKYALVLVDLQMPDMDGLDLIRKINEMPPRRRPAKLVITGRTDDIAPETCDELGIASTVQKPASLVELTEKVRLALTRPLV